MTSLEKQQEDEMSVYDEFLAANAQYAREFDRGDLPMPPARHVAVVTCMDARLHPEKFLGLEVGDAHVIRNAGGRASEDALRSLAISETRSPAFTSATSAMVESSSTRTERSSSTRLRT